MPYLKSTDPSEERRALIDGWTKATKDGSFKGSLEDFLDDQVRLYKTAPEGDPRLKTWLSGETIANHRPQTASIDSLKRGR